MPTIQVPVYNMRIYSVVGLKLDGITPTVAITHIRQVGAGSAQFDGQTPSTGEVDPGSGALALDGQTPDAYVPGFAEPDDGSLVTFGTDAEFTNTGDMRLILGGLQPDALDSGTFPTAEPGTGSIAFSGEISTRGAGMLLGTYAPVPSVLISPQADNYTLNGLSIQVSKLTSPAQGAMQIDGRQPQLKFLQLPLKASPQNAEADINGLLPDVMLAGVEYPDAGALQLDGKQPTPVRQPPDTVSPQDVPLAIDGKAPDLTIAGVRSPDTEEVNLNGLQVTPIEISPGQKVIPQNAEMASAGLTPTAVPNLVKPGAGALALAGTNAAIGLQPRPVRRPLAIHGHAPTAELSGTQAQIGTIIENTNATTDVPSNYQICDITGFKVEVDEPFVEDWRGYMMRKKSWSERHPQDYVKGVKENAPGSESPEPDDEFVEDLYPNGVSSDDL